MKKSTYASKYAFFSESHYSLKLILSVYNTCSFSLYFISSIFFLNHIGLLSSPINNSVSNPGFNLTPVNLLVISVSLLGCTLLIVSQQHNLYKKALRIIYKQTLSTKVQWLYDLGVSYKAIVQLTSFFALMDDYLPLPLSLSIAVVVGVGLVRSSFYMENIDASKNVLKVKKEFFYAMSYALCISALYYNTFNHIIITVLNEAHRLDGQLLLFLPNFFFTFLFFVGTSILVIRNLDTRIFYNVEHDMLAKRIFPVFSGICITWKTIVNILSLLSLLSILLPAGDDLLMVMSIPLFFVVSLTQFIFFEGY